MQIQDQSLDKSDVKKEKIIKNIFLLHSSIKKSYTLCSLNLDPHYQNGSRIQEAKIMLVRIQSQGFIRIADRDIAKTFLFYVLPKTSFYGVIGSVLHFSMLWSTGTGTYFH